MSLQPLVSCIMPTYNRPRFVPQAIRHFLSQDYRNKELLILDDGTESVAGVVPADPQIRYLRLDQKMTLGTKRNLACQQASGDIIAHWDDDDWMAPYRISYQVGSLLKEGAEVCGLRQILFYELASSKAWLYEYPISQRRWLAGGSLLYTRDFWARSPFPNVQVGEDTLFVRNNRLERAVLLSDYGFYVAMIHPSNTSLKNCDGSYWSHWSGDIRLILGQDLSFYESIARNTTDRESRMKINLGCCDAPLPGFTNVDATPAPGVQVADLRQPWPWSDDSVDYVRAWDIIEHLPDKIFTMNELWRVLKPGGRAEIAVPTTEGSGAWQDPTHVSFWNRRSFLYYEMENPYRERFARFYGIQAKFKVINERTDHSQDGPRLSITLEAVKP